MPRRWIPLLAALPLIAACSAEEPLGDEWGQVVGKRTFGVSCGGMVPPAPSFDQQIDAPAEYVKQTTCDPTAKPGVEAFRDLVLATYSCTTGMGIERACDVGGTSEHKEGRAWDWGISVGNAAADDLLAWLLAKDEHGNDFAMARRLGVMYIVWNEKIWGAYRPEDGWRDYTGSNPHTDHVHFSFSWDGANKLTSFWTKELPDGGPVPIDGGGEGVGPRTDGGEEPAVDSGGDLPATGTLDEGATPPEGCSCEASGSHGIPILSLLLLLALLFRRRA